MMESMPRSGAGADLPPKIAARVAALLAGELATPFSLLGIHPSTGASQSGRVIRAFLPWAESVQVVREGVSSVAMEQVHPSGVFVAELDGETDFFRYRLRAQAPDGPVEMEDPYRFPPTLSDTDLARVTEVDGRVHEVLGAQPTVLDGVEGVRFAVWAPGVKRVSVVGAFNGWDARVHPMRPRGASGVWELFLPELPVGSAYKYAIRPRTGPDFMKADPYARRSELRPATASLVAADRAFEWSDAEWLAGRGHAHRDAAPISIYEVHATSWKRKPGARPREGFPGWLSYRELAEELLPYVKNLGFTHVELLPVTEHPLDRSWGYQPTGYFAPSGRQGTADDFRYFVDRAHELGIGVILDWVPAHFASDGHGLARFVGSALYEYPDPRRGRHPDWGTYVFDYGRPEVRAFLVSSALYWIEDLHIDGLRIDAVASMLYLDYSRPEGTWTPNVYGGREHLEAVEFLRELNGLIHREHPDVLMIAEESTAWPGVTHSVDRGGLAFDLKWNMGWMHDTLEFFGADSLFRPGLYERLTFSIMYTFSERFLLALSHDEVVHLKRPLLRKMPGPVEQKFANLRLLYGYMWTHPGKKLLFMGAELAAWREWDFEGELDWPLLDQPLHAGVAAWVRALNQLYGSEPALHANDNSGSGFEWIDCHDQARTVLAYLRWAPEWAESVVVVANFSSVAWRGYRLPVPKSGTYEVLLCSDDVEFGGAGRALPDPLSTTEGETHGREQFLEFNLPALSVLVLKNVDQRR